MKKSNRGYTFDEIEDVNVEEFDTDERAWNPYMKQHKMLGDYYARIENAKDELTYLNHLFSKKKISYTEFLEKLNMAREVSLYRKQQIILHVPDSASYKTDKRRIKKIDVLTANEILIERIDKLLESLTIADTVSF